MGNCIINKLSRSIYWGDSESTTTVPLNADLLNGYAYNELPLNMELLWTNEAPTSQFSGQTINIDLTDYEFVYIVYKLYYSSTTNSSVGELAMKGRNEYTYIGAAGYIWYRQADITDNSITFSGCVRYATYGSGTETANNERLIPLYIYGVK